MSDDYSNGFNFDRQVWPNRQPVDVPALPPPPVWEQIPAADRALSLLRRTDYVEFRVSTPDRTPSPAWLAWREQLREVVRGNAIEIPPEPERYNAP